MMYKLLLIAVPLLWVGGTLFLLGYYAYHHQFDLMYLTLIILLNSLILGDFLNNQQTKQIMTEQQNEIMTDEDAIRYSLETLVDLDEHCTSEEQRAELAQVISVMTSLLDSYENCTFGNLMIGGEEDGEA